MYLKLSLNAVIASASFAFLSQTQAAVLDFEDLTGDGSLPPNYAGLSWDPNWTYYDDAQPPYNPSSGVQRIYTHNFGGWIDFGTDVTFQGSWVASLDVGQEMYWGGYDNGVKVFESAHLLGGAQNHLNVNWPNVDYVNFVSTSFNYFILDDIKFNGTNRVPDSSSTALNLFLALGGLGLVAATAKQRV
jgi:hypothetical protein